MMTISEPDGRAFQTRPLIGVGAVVWYQGQVLLIQRGKEPNIGSWSIPGGAQELGETAVEAVQREVFEETGVKIAEPRLVDIVDLIAPSNDGRIKYHYTLIDYVAVAKTSKVSAGGDAADAKWVDLADLRKYGLWRKTTEIIEKSRTLVNT